jgi:hypothetical protein
VAGAAESNEEKVGREAAVTRAVRSVKMRRKASMMGTEPDLADHYSRLCASLSVGLVYSAFIAPAPLFLLVSLVLSHYFVDKFALLRDCACGWVRGSHSAAQARVSGAASHWMGAVVVLHLAATSAGFSAWPHSRLCPASQDNHHHYHSTEGRQPLLVSSQGRASQQVEKGGTCSCCSCLVG